MNDAPPATPWQRRSGEWLRRAGPWGRAAGLALAATIVTAAAAAAVAAAVGADLRLVVVTGAACALALALPYALWAARLGARLDDARRELAAQATHDALTGLSNRRHFLACAEREWERCRRYGTDGSLLLIDADHLHSVGDSHGRPCSEALLREIARATRQSLRPADVVGRFGSAQLIVFLPHADPLGALDAAERIRVQVGDLRVDCRGAAVGTTASIGVATVNAGQASLDVLIDDADQALAVARQAGRNCVRAAPVLPRPAGVPGSSVGDRRPAGPV